MKKKGFSLVASIISAVFSVLAFIGLAFNFVTAAVTSAGRSTSEAGSRADWLEILSHGDVYKAMDKSVAMWTFARVLMIITFIVLAVLAVLLVVQLFYNHKILALLTKILGIAGIVLSIAFLIFFVVGGINLSTFEANYTLMYLPNVGPFWIMVCGVVASGFALGANKKAK